MCQMGLIFLRVLRLVIKSMRYCYTKSWDYLVLFFRKMGSRPYSAEFNQYPMFIRIVLHLPTAKHSAVREIEFQRLLVGPLKVGLDLGGDEVGVLRP